MWCSAVAGCGRVYCREKLQQEVRSYVSHTGRLLQKKGECMNEKYFFNNALLSLLFSLSPEDVGFLQLCVLTPADIVHLVGLLFFSSNTEGTQWKVWIWKECQRPHPCLQMPAGQKDESISEWWWTVAVSCIWLSRYTQNIVIMTCLLKWIWTMCWTVMEPMRGTRGTLGIILGCTVL